MAKILFIFILFWSYQLKGQMTQQGEFDFFIGSWQIDHKIKIPGEGWKKFKAETNVQPILHGKALIEHWEGEVFYFWAGMEKPEFITGYSLRLPNPSTGLWEIYWIDSENHVPGEPFEGNFSAPGVGEFLKEFPGPRYSRIKFNLKEKDTLYWELATSTDKINWQPLWIMEMERLEK